MLGLCFTLAESCKNSESHLRCRLAARSDPSVAANMRCKDSYPEDFQTAIKRSPLKEGELEELCAKSTYPPVFVYGHLMLPTALKYIVDIPQAATVDMVYATLPGYKLYHFAENGKPGLPTIKPSSSSSDMVEGMLVFGLTRQQRSDVQEVECVRTGHSIFIDTQVQVSLIDKIHGYEVKSQKSVDAGTFVWSWTSENTELQPMETSFWPIDDFLSGQLYANMVREQNKVPFNYN